MPLIVMGKILAAAGLQGWLKVKSYTDAPEDLLAYPHWYLADKDGKVSAFELQTGKKTPAGLEVKLCGIENRTEAEKLRGQMINIPRTAFLPLAAGEYYRVDLLGLAVQNRNGEVLGTVSAVTDTGVHAVLAVTSAAENRLIPFVAQYIDFVDLERQIIGVDWQLDY